MADTCIRVSVCRVSTYLSILIILSYFLHHLRYPGVHLPEIDTKCTKHLYLSNTLSSLFAYRQRIVTTNKPCLFHQKLSIVRPNKLSRYIRVLLQEKDFSKSLLNQYFILVVRSRMDIYL